MEEFARITARGLSDVIVAYDPSRIILDGSVIRNNSDLLLPLLYKHVDRFLPLPEIRMSRLHGLAPLLGASVIARGYNTAAGSLLAGVPRLTMCNQRAGKSNTRVVETGILFMGPNIA